MLNAKQMEALRNAKGQEFDRLFLTGMIQHHNGALIMVKDLFDSAGAGQDAELFNFVSDVDSGQRAEIKLMQNMMDQSPNQENHETSRPYRDHLIAASASSVLIFAVTALAQTPTSSPAQELPKATEIKPIKEEPKNPFARNHAAATGRDDRSGRERSAHEVDAGNL